MRIGIEGAEEIFAAVAGFVLVLSGPEGFGEVAPERIEAAVAHLEDAADVRGFVAVEEQVGGGRIAVDAVGPLEKSEGHEGVEEIGGGPGVESESGLQVLEVAGLLRQLGEDSEFDGAEERFGGPEAEADLQNLFGRGVSHANPSVERVSARGNPTRF